jgi:hypothetical protein
MKTNLLMKSKKMAIVFGMTILGLSSKAAVILQSSTNNAQALTITTPASGVTQYNYEIPYYETTLTSPVGGFIFRSGFTCGSGYTKVITCNNTQTGAIIAGTANGSAGTFTLAVNPSAIGVTYYTLKTSCYNPANSGPNSNIVITNFRINITRATAPTINNFSLSSSCNQSLNTSTMQYQNNGSASLYIETGNFANVKSTNLNGEMFLRYTKQDNTFTDFTFASHQSQTGLYTHSGINGNVLAGTHKVSLVYKYKAMGTTSAGVVFQNSTVNTYLPVSGSTAYPSLVWSTLTKVLTIKNVICLPELSQPKNAKIVYPNTVHEHVTVKAEDEKIVALTVYDLTNNIIKKVSFTNNNEEEKIDLSDLQKGMYIIEIETETSKERKQIIKD